jgi:hypothetical protein
MAMIRDDALLKQLPIKLDFTIEPLIFCKTTSLLKKSKPKARAIVCTEFAIYLYKKKFHKGYIPNRILDFLNVSQLKSNTTTSLPTFTLTVEGGDVTFQDPDTSSIAKSLAAHFNDIFRPLEVPVIKANEAIVPDLPFSANSFLKCIRFRAHQLNRRISEAFQTSVIDHARRLEVSFRIGCHETLDFSEFADFEAHNDLFFYALVRHREFNRVIIPKRLTQAGIWTEFAHFMKTNKTVKSIVCRDSVDVGFEGLIDALQQAKGSCVESFEFIGAVYDRSFVDRLFRQRTITTLVIEEGLTEDACQILVSRIEELRNLTRLSLVSIPSLSFWSLCSHVDQLSSLTVSKCRFDIADVLLALSQRQTCGLREVIATGSKSQQVLPSKLQLPASLLSFSFADIEWSAGNLKRLIVILSAHRPADRLARFKVDLSSIRQSPEQWQDFNEFLTTHPAFPVSELVYNNNPITRQFLAFLATVPSVVALSLGGCMNGNDELIADFCRYLKRNRTLVELHICGSEKAVLGSSMKQVLDSIKYNQCIRVLDIRHQRLGFELIPMLEEFFQHNKTVDEIFIDGNNLLDIQSFEALLAHLVVRNWKLILHVPSQDLLSLFEMNNVSSSKAERLVRLVQQLKNCQDARPLASSMAGSYGESLDPDEVLYEIRHSYLEDNRWQESLNFAPMADENIHYDLVDSEFSFPVLVGRLKIR